MEQNITKIYLIIIVLLLSGIVIGFLIGGKTMQDRWSSFYEDKEEEIERYCVCNFPKTIEEGVYIPFNYQDEK